MKPKPHGGQRLSDLVRHVRGSSHMALSLTSCLSAPTAFWRPMAADGGRDCKRVLTDAEIDLLLAGDEPKDAACG